MTALFDLEEVEKTSGSSWELYRTTEELTGSALHTIHRFPEPSLKVQWGTWGDSDIEEEVVFLRIKLKCWLKV